jgi:hypothetical protein
MLAVLLEPKWLFFGASIFLVSVPVFFQAPLVRALPFVTLGLSAVWFGLSWLLQRRNIAQQTGDLLDGFAWTWLTGSIYWGWFRTEPLLHLPIEALGLPIALMCILRQRNTLGSWFYVGSLLGTCLTDLYFYLVNLIPYWRKLMEVDVSLTPAILREAVSQMQTPWGASCAVAIVLLLLAIGSFPLRSSQIHWRVFSGAILSTVLVDGLFWIAATSA